MDSCVLACKSGFQRQTVALFRILLWTLCVGLLLLGTARAENEVLGLRLGVHPDKSRIVLDLSDEVPYALFTLADPYRLVIDLPQVEWSAKTRSASSSVGLISGYRFGLFQQGNSRLVLDLKGPALVKAVYFLPQKEEKSGKKDPTRLVIDLVAASRDAFLKSVATPRAVLAPPQQPFKLVPPPSAGTLPRGKPSTPLTPATPKEALAMLAPPPPQVMAPEMPPPKPGKPQLKVSRAHTVVIDAGHGGVDPGAISSDGNYEKAITLDVAKRLKVLLGATGRYRVLMTRENDVFVRLGERVATARDSGAELFISVHADTIDLPKLRGASVYTLSEQASDKEAEALAAKENSSDMIAGLNISGETDEIVKSILIDLAQRETMNKSVRFAKLLLPELGQTGALLKNSHRFAGFRVLKAPDVPSVLVELGLLSNPRDAKILTSNSGRHQLATAIKQAVDAYFRDQ